MLGKQGEVRKYYSRSWKNDLDSNNKRLSEKLKNMRTGDRQRTCFGRGEKSDVTFTGKKSFSRSNV